MFEGYNRKVLPNGLRLIGIENSSVHSFVCGAHVHIGPRFEHPHETGLSHFLEHTIMQGSAKFPSSNEIMRAVEDLGGVMDAATLPEYMNLSLAVHRKHWRRGMEILSDVLLHPLFDEQEVEQEKRIVAQEIRQHRDQQWRNISAWELAYNLLFKEELDEGGIRGSPALLESFNRDTVESYYRRFFVPQNVVLCLAGNFDFEEVCGEVAGSFEGWSSGAEVPEPIRSPIGPRRRRAIWRITQSLPMVECMLCYHAYPGGDERSYAASAVTEILGGGLSSRLFRRVREDLGLVYEIHSFPQTYSDTGSANISLRVDDENLTSAVEATLGVIQELLTDGVEAEELARYKESIRCGMEIMCDRPEAVVDWFGKQELILPAERIITPRQYVEKQESLTRAGLQGIIEAVFDPEGAKLAIVGPFDHNSKEKLRTLFPAEEVPGTAD